MATYSELLLLLLLTGFSSARFTLMSSRSTSVFSTSLFYGATLRQIARSGRCRTGSHFRHGDINLNSADQGLLWL